MKNRFSYVVLVALLVVGLAFAASDAASAAPRIGIVFSTGGLGDQSFNDAAYRGLQEAQDDFGIEFTYVEPADVAEMEEHLRALAYDGYDLIIAIGFQMATALEEVAWDYPDMRFAIVDEIVDLPNVASLMFKEHEGSFLVGLVAGMMSETNTVGFVGGIEAPLIRKFQVGYEEGVKWANPDARVLVNYAGDFGDPGRGKELAISQFERDADVVYHAAGGTGLGVIEAAEELGFYAIGVDSDQDHLAEGCV